MPKELRYMVFDCETATLPFAEEIAHGDSEKKKRIAIAMISDGQLQIAKVKLLIRNSFLLPKLFLFRQYLIPPIMPKSVLCI